MMPETVNPTATIIKIGKTNISSLFIYFSPEKLKPPSCFFNRMAARPFFRNTSGNFEISRPLIGLCFYYNRIRERIKEIYPA